MKVQNILGETYIVRLVISDHRKQMCLANCVTFKALPNEHVLQLRVGILVHTGNLVQSTKAEIFAGFRTRRGQLQSYLIAINL